MSALFMPALLVHVIVAVLGLGSIGAMAVVARAARRGGSVEADVEAWLRPLLRASAFSLGLMLATGVMMDLAAGGAFHERWWFRASALLLLGAGVLNGRARGVVRQGLAAHSGGDGALRRLEGLAYGMCGFLAAITVLMEVRPF